MPSESRLRGLTEISKNYNLMAIMEDILKRIEAIDQMLQNDPIAGFELAVALLHPPPVVACDHARALSAYATSCRVFGDLHRAELSFDTAAKRCSCDRCSWDRLRRMVYLRTEQDLLENATALAHQAIKAAPDQASRGRCRVAAAYVELVVREHAAAIDIARQAVGELASTDLLYLIGAVTTIGVSAGRCKAASQALLLTARKDLRELRRQWPRNQRYRSARGKVAMVLSLLGYKLGAVDPCELRATLARVQRQHVELGLWRDAVLITAESAEICGEMRYEELVARTLHGMLDNLPSSLPRHVTVALRKLRRSLEAIDRAEIARAVGELRTALTFQPKRARSVLAPAF